MITIDYDDIQLEWFGPQPSFLRHEIEQSIRQEIRQRIKPKKAWQMEIGHVMATHGRVIYIFGQAGSEAYCCTSFF